MKNRRRLLPAAALLASVILSAQAARAAEWGGIFSAVMLTSDYRFQGVSSSNRRPAMQGYVHWYRPDGYYLGAFASQVDYGYPGGPTYEVDAYAGKNFRLEGGKSELKLEAMYSAFPDNGTWGPTLDFLQLKAAAKRTTGRLTLGGAVAFTPEASYRSGEATLAQAEAAYQVTPALRLKAGLGRRWAERNPDRTFWTVGAAYVWKTATFELRYEDSGLRRAQCGLLGDACEPALVGQLTVTLPPIL